MLDLPALAGIWAVYENSPFALPPLVQHRVLHKGEFCNLRIGLLYFVLVGRLPLMVSGSTYRVLLISKGANLKGDARYGNRRLPEKGRSTGNGPKMIL